jgi:hypothetical protein
MRDYMAPIPIGSRSESNPAQERIVCDRESHAHDPSEGAWILELSDTFSLLGFDGAMPRVKLAPRGSQLRETR